MKIFLFAIFGFIATCGGDGSSGGSDGYTSIEEEAAESVIVSSQGRTKEAPPGIGIDRADEAKIIRNGHMSIQVSNLDKARGQVDGLVRGLNGYYENENFQSYGNTSSYNLTIRIPNDKMDTLIYALQDDGIGKLLSKGINAQDVTEEYVDLNIRLKNNEAYLDQYNTILKKAKTIGEVLEVQEKIRKIREEIESKKGRLQYLENKVSLSTLRLDLQQESAYTSTSESFISKVSKSFKGGFRLLQSLILGLINLWPLLLLLIASFIFRKRIAAMISNK